MRTQYRNGEDIGLQACGCDGCKPANINGVLCHETGCPYAWKDATRECRECGCDFHPIERDDSHCEGCMAVAWLDDQDHLDERDAEDFD